MSFVPLLVFRGVTLTTEDVVGNQGWVSVTYDRLHEEVGPGQEILIDDGLVAIRVDRIEGKNIVCTVATGRPMESRMAFRRLRRSRWLGWSPWEKLKRENIVCTVESGGTLSANKSINIPGVHISLPALTEREDL